MYVDKSKRIYAQNITELSKPIGPRIINKESSKTNLGSSISADRLLSKVSYWHFLRSSLRCLIFHAPGVPGTRFEKYPRRVDLF